MRKIFKNPNYSPSPGTYKLPSDFDSENIKGKSFGIARDLCETKNKTANSPGPGTYDSINVLGKTGLKYTFRPKTIDTSILNKQK